jgi:hypothetical protein
VKSAAKSNVKIEWRNHRWRKQSAERARARVMKIAAPRARRASTAHATRLRGSTARLA